MGFNAGAEESGKDEIIDNLQYIEADLVQDSGDILVIRANDQEAMAQLGCTSLWCFSRPGAQDDWESYAPDGYAYVIYDFSKDFEESTFMMTYLPNGNDLYTSTNFPVAEIGIEDVDKYLRSIGVDVKKLYSFEPSDAHRQVAEIRNMIRKSLIEISETSENIIYTIGNEENYDELLEERPLHKSKGGSAWKTLSAVKKHLKKTGGTVLVDGWETLPAAIYKMKGNWDSDVDVESDDYGLINKKLKIIEKVSTNNLNESKKNKFKKLEDNKVPLTDEERKKVMDADAVWHHGLNGAPSPAVWKSKDKNGELTFVTNTHRMYQSAKSIEAAINKYHKHVKQSA